MLHATRRAVLVAVVAALTAGRAAAQTPTNTWTATASGNWSTASNWDTNSVPASAASTILQFNNPGGATYTATQDVANPFQLNGLIFNSPGGAVTVTNAAGNSLSLVANGGAPPFLVQNNAGAATLGNTGTVTFAAGPTFGGGGAGAVTVSSPVVFSGAGLVLNGFNTTTLSGAITLPSAALPITGNGVGSVAFTGAAGGTPTSVTVNTGAASFDTGFVQFSSATSSFTAAGGIALQSGNLILGGAGTSTAGPLGAPANVLTVTGGALRASAAATVFNPVTVGGTDLLYVGTVATTLNGAISVTGTAGLQVLGTGGLTVNNAAAFNGPTTVGLLGFGAGGSAANGSTLTVGSTATTTGSLLNTTAVTVNTPANSNTSGNLVLTNATAASNNRLSAAAPITLNGGRVTYVAASGANSQAFGAVTANGYGGIGTQTTNAGTALTFDSLALPNKATFAFRGSIGAGNNSTVTFTNGVTGQSFTPLAPGGSGTVPILPWAPGLFGTGGNTTALNSLVTTDGTNGVRVLNPASATDFAIAAAGGSLVADQNNYYGNAGNPTAIPANTTVRINSLVLNTGSITLAGGPGSVLQVFSGAVMTSGSGTIAVPTLDFGTHTGYLYPPSQMTMNAALTGSAGLVVAGYQAANAGTFLLLNAPNSVTGGLTVNGSVPVQFRDDRSLGAAGGGITLGGGTLQFIAGGAFALTRPVVLTPAGGALSGTGPNAIQSLITLDTSLVSGSGPLALLGGTVALSGIAGGGWSTFVSGGVVQFAGENNFGSGPITLNGGTLQPTTAAAFTRPLRVNASSTIDVGGLNPTFSGPISTLGYTAAAGTPPALTKAGTGTLTLTADSPFAGTVTVSAGGLTLGGATGRLAGAAAATVAAGASLTLDNTAANNNDRFAGPVTLTGGSFTLAGNSAGTAETIGTLSSTAPGSVVTIAPPAGVSALLKAASLNVPPAGTLVIRGTNLGAAGSAAALVFLTTPPTLLNGIIPGVVGDNDPVNGGGSFLVSYSSVAGVVPATLAAPTSMIQNAAPTNTPATANVLTSPGAATVQDQGNVINSLTLTAGTSLDAGGPLTLTMTSGMVVARAGGASTVGGNVTLASPAGTGLTVAAAGDLAALGPLSSGSGAVTKLGAGNLSLLAANTFTGTLTAGAGTVSVAAPTSAAGLAGSGAVAVATGATLTLTGTGTTTLFGPLSGAGSLLRTSTATGTQVLAGPVTLSGSLESDAGTLSLQTGVAAAASPIVIGGGGSTVSATLQVAPGLTISRGIDFQTGGGRALSMSAGAPGQPATTLAGQLTVESIVTLVVGTNNATYNVTGQVTGGGSI
ncbi:MAG TPA: autotransporter-associated beta strand repeat-containing protein, partial [Gemmataceae bacterium]